MVLAGGGAAVLERPPSDGATHLATSTLLTRLIAIGDAEAAAAEAWNLHGHRRLRRGARPARHHRLPRPPVPVATCVAIAAVTHDSLAVSSSLAGCRTRAPAAAGPGTPRSASSLGDRHRRGEVPAMGCDYSHPPASSPLVPPHRSRPRHRRPAESSRRWTASPLTALVSIRYWDSS